MIAIEKYCFWQLYGDVMIYLCAIRQLRMHLDAVEEFIKDHAQVALNEAYCLCAIDEGIVEPGALAKMIGLSPSRLSRILDNLETKHLILRSLSRQDRRSIVVDLSSDGYAKIAAIRALEPPLPSHLASLLSDKTVMNHP